MKRVISTKELRASLPKVVEKVRRGARFTVLYRSRPAFQIIPVDAEELPASRLDAEPFYKAGPLGRAKDGLSAADHDRLLYGK